jgi:hypothetical protein
MSKEIRQFYVFRVDDLKPVSGECCGEAVDPDEFVYLVDGGLKNVVILDVGVSVHPQTRERAEYDSAGSNGRRNAA